ncbi:exodeoxyribonuclease VII large subunit [Peribacillus deserti]|uniref:Exodeoxyribonuclease 7 large subunit n=1 Tax=Peribacillus deserti TaxID=673318 RepID=A0ABS2QLY5_9BACI|nr:exodeoxyribonuclease VII large subunit [Peribacillus deserti]MBM7693251.1 exodeoxyribonuclease VII large subunit [Peribacillus deserti]
MNQPIYLTIHALTKYIKRKFDADPHLQNMFIKGEISNLKQHSSGHMYFTLKDEKARILAVMFQTYSSGMKFSPENGMHVLIKGDITVYEPSGQYQIYVKEMAPDGIGELYLAYEQLKTKLEQEGLFLNKYKKAIPVYPKTVGVITSPTGAAIRDIITTLRRRYPIANIMIYPALVQGTQAPQSVVRAIETANSRNEADVLIIGRGGGSIEELWAFNEEKVARAVFSSKIPIISAVGHETDFTISDFVADLRAPTPTGAAELAVPHINDILERLLSRKNRMTRELQKRLSTEQSRLLNLEKSYAFRYPQRLYEQKLEQLDRTMDRFNKGFDKYFVRKKETVQRLSAALRKRDPEELLHAAHSKLELQSRLLKRMMEGIYKSKLQSFLHAASTLDARSPLKIMDKGYSLVYTDNDELIKNSGGIQPGDKILVRMKDGELSCLVEDKKERPIDE